MNITMSILQLLTYINTDNCLTPCIAELTTFTYIEPTACINFVHITEYLVIFAESLLN